MKSGRFKNRFWPGAFLTSFTLLLNACFCQGIILADSPEDHSSANRVANSLSKSSSDLYWRYYDDCDRWGIQFARFDQQTALEKQPINDSAQVSRFTKKPFRMVKHVMPKNRGPGRVFKGQTVSNFAGLKSSWLQLCGIASRTFEQRILPSIQYFEFVAVESATYPDFFLNENRPNSRRLFQVWCQAKVSKGVAKLTSQWKHRHRFEIQVCNWVFSKIRPSSIEVLQKGTIFFRTPLSSLNN